MTTTNTTSPGGALPRPLGMHLRHTFAAGLAVFLAASAVTARGQDKSERNARFNEKILEIANREKGADSDGRSELKKGYAAFEKEDCKSAVKSFKAAAARGNTDAMLMLSYCLAEGKGVEKDEDESLEWAKRAADAGNAAAMAFYGENCLDQIAKKEEGLKSLKRSAERGCVFGQVSLGLYLLRAKQAVNEDGVENLLLSLKMRLPPGFEDEDGTVYLKEAARHPLSNEKSVLDYIMESDPEVEEQLFGDGSGRTVNDRFVITAQLLLGKAYLDGAGAERDLPEAKKWLELAKENGSPAVDESLSRIEAWEEARKTAASGTGTGDGRAEYEKGIAAYEKGHFEAAVEFFLSGAEKGDVNAQLMLGMECMRFGKGTKQDVDGALEWVEKAMETGDPLALCEYGFCLVAKDEEEEGVKYMEQSAEKGCVMGMMNLAFYYMEKGDETKSLKYFRMAAVQPLRTEKTILDYLTGIDDDKFENEHKTAENMFIVLAQIGVGNAYMSGEGVEKDLSEARKWFELARKNGIPDADKILEVLSEQEKEETEEATDGNEAESGDEAADSDEAESGDGSAELKRGLAACEAGKFKAAVKSFRAAAARGNTDAMLMLAYCLDEGKGVEKDEKEYLKLLKKAADAGNAAGQAMYGMELMEDGEQEEAVRYLRRSAEQGCLLGRISLGFVLLDDDDESEAKKGFDMLLKLAQLPPTDEKSILDYMTDEDDADLFRDKDISAATSIIVMAQCMVGRAYSEGLGVKADPAEAKKWLRKAVEGGMIPAEKMLEEILKMEKDADDEDEVDDED